MKKLYIFGSSGFAVECAQLALRNGNYEIASFIDKDDIVDKDSFISVSEDFRIPIISELSFLNEVQTSNTKKYCIIAIANSIISNRIYNKFKDWCLFPSIIDPSSQLNDIKKIGIGNLIFQNVIISWDVEIGKFNKFLFGTHVGHETIIGDFNEFNPKVSISGNCNIKNNNLFGVGSMMIQGARVGENNTIGMGAVAIRNIKSNEIWFGNPAKLIDKND